MPMCRRAPIKAARRAKEHCRLTRDWLNSSVKPLPTALEIPMIELDHIETPTPFTPLGTKGAGESGITGPLSAIASAIENAFPEKKLALMETPLSPSRVWRAIQAASAA